MTPDVPPYAALIAQWREEAEYHQPYLAGDTTCYHKAAIEFKLRCADELAAALPASPPAAPTGWQPIATAPKDGTPVLVIFRGKYHVARYAPLWAADNLRWIVDHPKWRDEDMQMVSEIDPNEHQRAYGLEGPTHWMPLPAAPTETP